MSYNNARFLKSIADLNSLPPDNGIEIAFAGRSNAGKSSALNTITGIKSLAKTQLINFFELTADKFLVDLPGYGYAKVAASVKKHWEQRLSEYIASRNALKGIMLIMDIRHPLKDLDLKMIEWCTYQQLKIHILLTKADKLTRNIANQTVFATANNLKNYTHLVTVQKFSSLNKEGLSEAHAKLDEWFAAAE